MKEILIKFNNKNIDEHLSGFIDNPFDVFIDGEKVPRLKRIEIDLNKYESNTNVINYDDFKYKIEQYVDLYGVED